MWNVAKKLNVKGQIFVKEIISISDQNRDKHKSIKDRLRHLIKISKRKSPTFRKDWLFADLFIINDMQSFIIHQENKEQLMITSGAYLTDIFQNCNHRYDNT